jgi:hypothetical protein
VLVNLDKNGTAIDSGSYIENNSYRIASHTQPLALNRIDSGILSKLAHSFTSRITTSDKC